jgi:DNA-binding MarR family transcriptional regulator
VAVSQLSPLELDAWAGFLETYLLLRRELDRRLVKGHGLLTASYGVLLRLERAGSKGVRMSELAEHAFMSSGGLTRLADRLERDGLITRTRSRDDLRGFEARITPAGRQALRRANVQHVADVRELFLDHVTEDELEVLAGVWGRVREANAELTQTASRIAKTAPARSS